MTMMNGTASSSFLALLLPVMMMLLLIIHGNDVDAAPASPKETVFRWASCGGGWRAMFTDAGFANALHRAGVSFDNTGSAKKIHPILTGLSSTSGGTWFSTQFFYSQEFYDSVLSNDADELYDFVLLWMDSYLNLTTTILKANATLCSLGQQDLHNMETEQPFPPGEPMQWCIIIRHYQGDWAAFVTDMLRHAANAYEGASASATNTTTPFPDRTAGVGERISALRNTDLIVQTSLAPMSRSPPSIEEGRQSIVYLGREGTEDDARYFSTMLPTAYTVSSVTGTAEFHIGNWSAEDMVAYYTAEEENNNTFSMDEYDGYYLYNGQDTSGFLFTSHVPAAPTQATGKFATPFSSSTSSSPPNTGQIASISSAALGSMSGWNPSELAQYGSTKLYAIQNDESLSLAESKVQQTILDKTLNGLYNDADGLGGVSVCSQWPNECGANDSRFSDGAYTDNPAFPMNVAQYQRDYPDSIDSTILKFVAINPNGVTPTSNLTTYNDAIYLGYFNTTFNVGIEPGDFLWAPGQPVPWPSTQIFDEFLDTETFHSKFEPVQGTNWTTAILKGTTVHNPVYGVSAGQTVEILYFMINSFIPSRLVGTDDIAKYSIPLAELTTNIATNEDLQSKIKTFFFEDDDDDAESTPSPVASPTGELASTSMAVSTPGSRGVSLWIVAFVVAITFASSSFY